MMIQTVEEDTGYEVPVFYHENLSTLDEAKGFLKGVIRFRPMVGGRFWDKESAEHGTKKFHFEIIVPIDEFEKDVLFTSESFIYETAYISLEQNFDLKQYNKEKFLELAKEWVHRFTLQTKASFWIDHRDADERELALACAKCVRKKMDEEKKERLAEYKKEAEEAEIEVEAMELPQLEGSEKQINWAMYIRKKLLPVADEAYISLEQNFDSKQYNKEKFLELAKEWLHRFKLQTKASFWIDHRDAGERNLALACAKCVRKKMDEDKQE